MTMSKNEFKKIAVLAARAGDAKKADPVTVYDLAGKSSLADFAVLAAVESAPQLDAVEEEVSVRLKHEGVYCEHKDGMRSKNWKVLDYGGVLVHVYDIKAAEFYAIDKVYSEYKTVEWRETPAAPAVKKAPAAKPAAAKKPAVKKPAVKKAAPKKAAAKKAKPAKAKKAPAKKAAKKTSKKKRPSEGHSPLKRHLRKQ